MSTVSARFTDGQRAREHRVSAEISANGVSFETSEQRYFWPAAGLRLMDKVDGRPRLAHDSYPDARLLFDRVGDAEELRHALPDIAARSQDRFALDLRRFGIAGAATVAIALMFYLSIPAMAGLLTALVPVSVEREIGESTLKTVGALLTGAEENCSEPEGLAVLERTVERLIDGHDLRVDVDVRVAPSGMVNAIALPGGYVIIFDGLIQQAASAEEVAGVLAHEIGHTQYRHGMQGLIRARALQTLISIVAPGGGGTGGLAREAASLVLNQSHSRDAEREADGYAVETLNRIGVSGDGLAGFFDRMAQRQSPLNGGNFAYLSSHPLSVERARSIREDSTGREPIMSDADWQALKAICGETSPEE